MSSFTKAKDIATAYFIQRSGIRESEWLEAKSEELETLAPLSESPYYRTFQPDGTTIISEIIRSEGDVSDGSALRARMGDSYANLHHEKESRVREEIPRKVMELNELNARLNDNRRRQEALMIGTPAYHTARREALKYIPLFFVMALGDSAALFATFADAFGIDPTHLGRDFTRHTLLGLATLFFTIAFFTVSKLSAEKALYFQKLIQRFLGIAGLVTVAIVVGKLRALNAASLEDTDVDASLLMAMYMFVSVSFPVAAAIFARRWEDASRHTSLVDGAMTRLTELDSLYIERLNKIKSELEVDYGRLDALTQEYVVHYQGVQEERRLLKESWLRHIRYVQARLASLRIAYRFWDRWHSRAPSLHKPAKRLAPIALVLAMAAALLLALSLTAHAADGFNLQLVCDRSSSANEFSCTSKVIEDAGRMWLDKADEAGGGSFQLFQINQGFDSTTLVFEEKYPESFGGPVMAHKKAWRKRFQKMLSDTVSILSSSRGSAIAEAIYRSSLRVPSAGETRLFVMSDLREVNKTFNFERRVPNEKEFLGWLDKEGITPKFTGLNKVMVCGVHPYAPSSDTSPMTAENYGRMFRLWQAVFRHWGVKASISEACDFGDY